MKRTCLLIIVMILLAGCHTSKYHLTPSFYEVKQADSVWIYSIKLPAHIRTLVVTRTDSMRKLPDTPTEQPKAHSAESASENSSYSSLQLERNMNGMFFSTITASRTAESLSRKSLSFFAESEKDIADEKDAEEINRDYKAQLVIVLRDIRFHFKSKYEKTRHYIPALSKYEMSSSLSDINLGASMVHYQSVWDLYWMEDSQHASNRRTIVQKGAYWVQSDSKYNPMPGILSCALKAGDDFVSLFK